MLQWQGFEARASCRCQAIETSRKRKSVRQHAGTSTPTSDWKHQQYSGSNSDSQILAPLISSASSLWGHKCPSRSSPSIKIVPEALVLLCLIFALSLTGSGLHQTGSQAFLSLNNRCHPRTSFNSVCLSKQTWRLVWLPRLSTKYLSSALR